MLSEQTKLEMARDLLRIQRRDNAYAAPGSSLSLRQCIRDKYAWPGGYELFGVTSDGAALCCDCMRAEYHQIAYARRHKVNDGWRVVGLDSTEACEEYLACDHCGRTLFEGE